MPASPTHIGIVSNAEVVERLGRAVLRVSVPDIGTVEFGLTSQQAHMLAVQADQAANAVDYLTMASAGG